MLLHLQRAFSRWTALKKKRAGFASDKHAYDFCRQVYNETNGVTPELRKAFESYKKHANVCSRDVKGGSVRTFRNAH